MHAPSVSHRRANCLVLGARCTRMSSGIVVLIRQCWYRTLIVDRINGLFLLAVAPSRTYLLCEIIYLSFFTRLRTRFFPSCRPSPHPSKMPWTVETPYGDDATPAILHRQRSRTVAHGMDAHIALVCFPFVVARNIVSCSACRGGIFGSHCGGATGVPPAEHCRQRCLRAISF